MSNEQRWFQWIIGERKGEILLFDRIETDGEYVYIVFKDDSRINEQLVAPLNQTSLTGMFMAEIDSPENCWKFSEEYVGREEERWETNSDGENVCVQPLVPGRKVIKLIPPKRSAPRKSNFGIIQNAAPVNTTPIEQPQVNTTATINNHNNIDINDPVFILINKSKKQDIDIQMNINISLPSKNLYNISKESFSDGSSKFIEYIIQDISVTQIKDALRVAISNMYEESDTQQ